MLVLTNPFKAELRSDPNVTFIVIEEFHCETNVIRQRAQVLHQNINLPYQQDTCFLCIGTCDVGTISLIFTRRTQNKHRLYYRKGQRCSPCPSSTTFCIYWSKPLPLVLPADQPPRSLQTKATCHTTWASHKLGSVMWWRTTSRVLLGPTKISHHVGQPFKVTLRSDLQAGWKTWTLRLLVTFQLVQPQPLLFFCFEWTLLLQINLQSTISRLFAML